MAGDTPADGVLLAAPPAPAADARQPFEAWVDRKKSPAWLAAAARSMRGWAIGREVTEQDFDAALTDAGAVAIGVTR